MSRHVQNTDTSVLERRLRPIYDWLDAGNNKKALQECDKVLKKTPNLQCAKALKALTLHRMGKEPDSRVILESLTAENPTDEATLQAMTLCLREMQELDKICKLYETAVKLEPTNEELHTHLFMSYVRISDFKGQQQSAMALYKQKPKNPYYCWTVMSIVLQATRGEGLEDTKKRELLLSLAERMMIKMVQDNKMDAEQEVQLLIMVLDLQKKYQEILELLEGPLEEKLQCTFIPQFKLNYLKKLGRWAEVNVLCKQILNEHFDKWDIWKEYVNSVFELFDKNSVNGDNHISPTSDLDSADNTPEKCHEFICGIIESGAPNSYQLRGPYLARFELISKLQQTENQEKRIEELMGDPMELFTEYFRKFGQKPCCVSDLKIYLRLLNPDKRLELSAKLIKDVGIGSTSVPGSPDQMQRHIDALQLSRLCGSHRNLSTEHLKALLTALTLHYQHGYQSYGKNLLPTDMGPSDNYEILAAHVLYDLARQEKNSDSLMVALASLENLLKNSPSNFHAKLLALKFYHILGDGVDANNILHSLDIKHLQLDSLGYIHCGRLATTGLFSLCAIHYDTTLKFFSTNYKDSTDHLTFSYKFGSFMKLDEFMDFRERMNNSIHYTTVAVDRIMLSVMDCPNLVALYNLDISPKDNKIEWDKLRDNRDINVYVSWEPELLECPLDENEIFKDLFNKDLIFLKLRTRILWSLSAAIDIVQSADGTRQKHIENLREILKEWKGLTEHASKEAVKYNSEELVVYPMPSRLHGFVETPYLKVIGTFLEFFSSLAAENMDCAEKLVKACEDELENLTLSLAKKTLDMSTDFQEKRKLLELSVNTVEVICVCSVVCMMCNQTAKPRQTKKGKKKPENHNRSKELLNIVVNKLKSEITKISDAIETWVNKSDVSDIASVLESLNLQVNSECLYRNISSSYLVSNKEIQGVLKSKLKMLSNL